MPPTGHIHLDGEICPTCEQVIPNDRLEQVLTKLKEAEALISAMRQALAAQLT